MRPERFKAVSVLDESYTWSLAERMDYAGARKLEDYAHRLKPGTKPVTYHLREVPHGLWEDYVDAADTYAEKYKRAFVCGVEMVENLPQADGVTLSSWKPNTKNVRSGSVIMSDDDLKLFAPSERAEIGSVIYMHSFLPRRIAPTYLLPLSLQEPVTSLAARLAVASQKDAAAMTSGALLADSTQSQAEPAKTTRDADSDSGSPMAATAAA